MGSSCCSLPRALLSATLRARDTRAVRVSLLLLVSVRLGCSYIDSSGSGVPRAEGLAGTITSSLYNI